METCAVCNAPIVKHPDRPNARKRYCGPACRNKGYYGGLEPLSLVNPVHTPEDIARIAAEMRARGNTTVMPTETCIRCGADFAIICFACRLETGGHVNSPLAVALHKLGMTAEELALQADVDVHRVKKVMDGYGGFSGGAGKRVHRLLFMCGVDVRYEVLVWS